MLDFNKIYKNYLEQEGFLQEYQHDYYEDEKSVVPVYKRKSASPLKEATHTNVHINFFEDIIQRKVGYMASDIVITSQEEGLKELLIEFEKTTKQDTKNIESVSDASISGISHRLLYTVDGVVKIKNIPGWQVVYDYDGDIYSPDNAYYFYSVTDIEGNEKEHCDIYSKTTVTYYEKEKHNKDFIQTGEEQPHNFNQVPIFPFQNNSGRKGDCVDSLSLMDIYDEIISDTAGELKAARLAYMKVWGDLYTGETPDGEPISIPEYLRDFGTMLFGTDDLGNKLGNAEFLEKKLDDTAISNMLDRLRGHIFEVSGSVDLKELTDSSDARVFTIQASISRLENNSKITERFTRIALKKQYELLLYWFGEYTGNHYEIEDIEIKFTRVFVQDKEALVKILQIAENVMSIEDAYEISELFDDSKMAAERFRKENSLIPDDDE